MLILSGSCLGCQRMSAVLISPPHALLCLWMMYVRGVSCDGRFADERDSARTVLSCSVLVSCRVMSRVSVPHPSCRSLASFHLSCLVRCFYCYLCRLCHARLLRGASCLCALVRPSTPYSAAPCHPNPAALDFILRFRGCLRTSRQRVECSCGACASGAHALLQTEQFARRGLSSVELELLSSPSYYVRDTVALGHARAAAFTHLLVGHWSSILRGYGTLSPLQSDTFCFPHCVWSDWFVERWYLVCWVYSH
ncbi:hypothetical protein GY45DRAFT_1307646 [Cubamyces sp. BRFM 1775]|nr:hypothetical protein GY45DRAFT_1307646 [Cubamyces sp. BRFM 1775]